MKKKLRGMKRHTMMLDFNLYRVEVPIPGHPDHRLSVIDLNPEYAVQTIVFVHGYAGCAETWEFQINHFCADYRVVVPDLRGHGQSDAPYSQYTMDEMVADLRAITDHLKLPRRFILVGHSFGGSICVEYANAYPETLEKLVLIATAGEYPLPRAVNLVSRMPTTLFQPLWRYRPRWNAELHVMKRMMLNNLRKWSGWSMLRNLSMSTLIITGERDNYFPRAVFDDVGKMVPNAEIYDVGSAKHKVQLERSQAVNRALERFIENQRGSWRQSNPKIANRPWLKHYSKDTPATVPIPKQPLYRFLESAASWKPKRIATIFYGHQLTYDQLNRQVNRFANALIRTGIQPGDRVLLVLPNCPEFIVAYYGALKAGVVVVLPNPDATVLSLIKQARRTSSRMVVTLDAYQQIAAALRERTSVEQTIFVDIRKYIEEKTYHQLLRSAGVNIVADAPGIEAASRFDAWIAGASDAAPDLDIDPHALANITFTSGTTDIPKGVCLTHYNLVANAMQTRHWVPDLVYGQEVFLSVLPFLHSYGLTSAMNIPITMAATMVLLSVFDLQQVLQQITKYRPTLFPGVPTMYTAINNAPNIRSYGLDSIKACISGAAPLPVEVQERFEKLTRGRLVEGYGLTEAAPITHANPLYGLRKVGSIGIPIPNTDAKVIDLLTGDELPPGSIGELVVRGPQVMRGYWQDKAEAESTSPLRDGWLHTGDVAVMDNDGYFTIIARKRDTIMTGSYSVYPRDVEEVLYENSKVLEVAVVGVGHENGEQRVKAFVVPRPQTGLSKEELIELCQRRLEPYAVPWDIEFRETLPKSFVGKVLRRLLVEQPVENQE